MIEDSRSAATGASGARVCAQRTSPYAAMDSAAPSNPRPACGRSEPRSPRPRRAKAYAGMAIPSRIISQARYPTGLPAARTPAPSTTV